MTTRHLSHLKWANELPGTVDRRPQTQSGLSGETSWAQRLSRWIWDFRLDIHAALLCPWVQISWLTSLLIHSNQLAFFCNTLVSQFTWQQHSAFRHADGVMTTLQWGQEGIQVTLDGLLRGFLDRVINWDFHKVTNISRGHRESSQREKMSS